MADDKIERQIAFIIDQQAKNTVNIARLEEKLNRLEGQVSRLTVQVDRITNVVVTMSEGMVDLKDALLSLTNIVERHDNDMAYLVERDKETDGRFREIHERLSRTDERLDTVITMLEKRQ
ncbi:MAG TPA: hypothetical protein VF131_06335 [Blastocatellia bacterium]|nr:hypothetical protein [Blastocatellia bacterium]